MESYINITKNPWFYKHKVFKHTESFDKDVTWYEVVYFTNYGTNHQSLVCKKFDTEKEAEEFTNNKIKTHSL
ncbi:MAG: hypothetical protein Unbinned5607contig1000_16 [Prokaryotic dsDNA virus sp.]|nr:MAG: hypothetical protein Unbinned5607contig1000_16 [Prokaryotic dsDNA virus sp.]|tara:strand:+ start:1058 stop:1273 length:216 start_codon:yes stop_codon:yes gene_type:complete